MQKDIPERDVNEKMVLSIGMCQLPMVKPDVLKTFVPFDMSIQTIHRLWECKG
jgi:hypothetical protein